MAEELPGKPPSAPAPQSVAGGSAPNPAGTTPPSPAAKVTAQAFGGNVGKRMRADGLKAGSPEAKEADRIKDAERKRLAYHAKKGAQPPPLPAAQPGQAAAPVAGAPQAPAGNLAPMPDAQSVPLVPWDAEMLKPAFEQLIPAVEELMVHQIADKAVKAKLPNDIVKDIEKDCQWSPVAKKGLAFSAPRVTAKWLNKLAVPSGSQDEIVLLTSLATIAAGHVKLVKRLDALAQAANGESKKPEEKK